MKVFISHISEEAALASVLKSWTESAFLGQVECFVSSNDMTSGELWFSRLGEELTDAMVMLVLCSKNSVSMPWINFEAGASHIKGIPVIPICHSGITVGTLPVPLFFFQGLDAGVEEFGVKVMEDLAKHLGYTQPPQIRYEDMAAEVREALAQIGQQSVQIDQEEMGFFDHLVLMMEQTASLTNFVSEFGTATQAINIETGKFADQSANAGNNPSSGTPQYLQRISRQFGKHLDTYAGKLESLNQKYEETLPDVGASLQGVLTFQDPQTMSESDWESIDGFLTVLDQTEQNTTEWKLSTLKAREAIEGLPNLQRDIRRATRKTVAQFDVLTTNLDNTLDMLHRARTTLNQLKLSRDL